VEDEAWQVEHTVLIVMEKELGHEIVLVQSIEEAERSLRSEPFDFVFIDVMLKPTKGVIELEKSGLQIAQRILDNVFANAGNPSSLPVIVASGVWDATIRDQAGDSLVVRDKALSMGIPEACFLRKPFLVEEVEELLEVCRRRRGESQ
jgi:hypothetical protein